MFFSRVYATTFLRRWSWCYSYCAGFVVFYYEVFQFESCLALFSRAFIYLFIFYFFLFFFFFFSVLLTLWSPRFGREKMKRQWSGIGLSWSVCFSCICLFILHALICILFYPSWCQGLTVGCVHRHIIVTWWMSIYIVMIFTWVSRTHLCRTYVFSETTPNIRNSPSDFGHITALLALRIYGHKFCHQDCFCR